MTLYLPISSQNFNNIFSTESISPHAFYSQRNFGIKRHFKTDFSLFDEYLLFYPIPIYFRLDNAMAEAYPMLLAIDSQLLNLDLASEFESKSGTIVAYPKSIYLNMIDFEVWFHSQQEKDNIIARAEAGLEVKAVNKYRQRFKVVSSRELKDFDLRQIISKQAGPNPLLLNEIKKDKSFNHFKGLVFGYFIGQIGQKSKSEIEFTKSLQDIINNFANMRSGFGISDLSKSERYNATKSEAKPKYGSKPKASGYEDKYGNSNLIDKQNLLNSTLQSIDKSEKLFNEIFEKQTKIEDIILSYLQSKVKKPVKTSDLEIFVEVSKLLPEIYELILKGAMQNRKGSEFEGFEFLRYAVNDYAINSKSATYPTYEVDEKIKNTIYKLEKFAEAHFIVKQKQNIVPDLSCFVYDIADQLQIHYDKFGSKTLTTMEIQIYEEIANTLLEFPKMQPGEIETQDILRIVAEVGKRLKSISGIGKEEVQDLRDLYAFLQNKLDKFNAEDLSSVVISNFTSFIFKPNSIEELQKFIEIKGIKESYIAYSFWCAFNGFASLSKTFTQALFTSDKSELGESIDAFLSQILKVDRISQNITKTREEPQQKVGFVESLFGKSDTEPQTKKTTTKKKNK